MAPMTLALVVLLAVLAAGLLVLLARYVWGLAVLSRRNVQVAGSAPAEPGQLGGIAMSPLGGIARLYTAFLLLGIVFGVWRIKDGIYGNGPNGEACVDTGITGEPVSRLGWRARPGTSLTGSGDLQACVAHPTAGQWALYALTALPGLVLWVSVLLMIMKLVRHAAQHGPFTPHAAVLMIRLGWLIIAGSVVAGALTTTGGQVLANMVIMPRPFDPGTVVVGSLLSGSLRWLLPVPALAGVALLSFGSITRAGAAMDEELRATV